MKNLTLPIGFLLFVFIASNLFLLNFLRADTPCHPSYICRSQARQECLQECGWRDCEEFNLQEAWCEEEECHSIWRIWCRGVEWYFIFECEEYSSHCDQS